MDAERKAESLESQLQLLGLYHRFSVVNGLERDLTKPIDPGVILAHTKVYVDGVQVSRRMDICIESLGIREGVSSLEQLARQGGNTLSQPPLPPLTKTFVMRKEPWDFVKKILLQSIRTSNTEASEMLIVTGIGGCGKTQLMIKFMNVHEAEFSSRFFIDGSNEDRIRADIIRSVRALGTEHAQKRFDECLLFLSSLKNNKPRLIPYDNVDDPELDLSSLLPRGSSCRIIITSRNRIIGSLYPESHLRLNIMSISEAVELLSYGSAPLTEQNREDIKDLARSLGYLPIALQQARSYMQQTGCTIKAYLARLLTNRTNLLGREIKQQLDMKAISTYAAFETSFAKLSLYAQRLLRLLAYFHWSEFPINLVVLAADHRFSKYRWKNVDHGNEFYSGKQRLEEIFLHDGKWDITNLDDTLISLQNYSLVTVASGVDTSISQMHPLVHEWLRSCTPVLEQDIYQSAAIVLLALGVHGDDTAIMQYLASHVKHLAPLWDHLDTNNAAALGYILYANGAFQDALKLQERVVRELRKVLDPDDLNLTDALWNLANTYNKGGRHNDAHVLQEEVLKICKRVLGERHSETLRRLPI